MEKTMDKFAAPGRFSNIVSKIPEQKLNELVTWYNSLEFTAVTPQLLHRIDETIFEIKELVEKYPELNNGIRLKEYYYCHNGETK